ncbi:MAG TPA: glycoside hydrolase family 44 protein, partial [Geobacteraceae bacterium]|nr:glycoside hydrolase family 44 protein [Geobacteraceae bacterium]
WQINMHNTGSDWYFENIPDGAAITDGSASDLFVEQDRRTGTRTLMTVPLIGWTPKNDSPGDHPYACGFKVSIYGLQQSTDPWDTDCGNGVYNSGGTITGNKPTDTSSAINPAFVTSWLNHLTGKYGTATNGGVAYYDLDNEPMLWNSTHRDVHPQATTYDELRDRTYQYAAAVKTADPSAKTLGPVLWGWCAYFYSALDGCGVGNDYRSHGNTPFVPWYLQQMKAYEQQHGVRILDYLDLHDYPQADGVALSSAGNSSTQELRLRSTRSLWDPSYIDESWISETAPGGVAMQLIPRMKDWVNTSYPGTRLAITEYNWGGLESVNGALAQADVLGIFGREGLDLATLWGPPTVTQPGAFAFRIYRNYDGAGHGFGDTSVLATSADQDKLAVYAARRSADNVLTIVVINKTSSVLTSVVNIAGISTQSTASVYRFSQANLKAIEHLADLTVTASGLNATFPGNSITLYVINSNISPPGNLRIKGVLVN